MVDLERESQGLNEVTATQTLLNNIISSGYQLVTTAVGNPKAMSNPVIPTFHGTLSGRGDEDTLPTVLVVAHYDASGAAPGLSYGSDSNASGVVMLLELARLWHKLYSSSKSIPSFNLIFLLSGGGKINYFGMHYAPKNVARFEFGPSTAWDAIIILLLK